MFSGDLLKRYFRYFILIVSIIIVVMGFLWLNFLYTRQERALEDLALSVAEDLEEQTQQRAHQLRLRGEYIKTLELVRLEELVENYGALLKASLYDIYYSSASPETRQQDVRRVLRNLSGIEALDIYVITEEFSLGEEIDIPASLEKGLNYFEDRLLFFDGSYNQDFQFIVSIDQEDYIPDKVLESFVEFSSWDQSIYLKDRSGRLLLPLEANHAEEGFYSEEFSQATGFTYGYFISSSAIDNEIASRRQLFRSFLESHIMEILGFLLIFYITSYIIYRVLIKQVEDYFTSINEEILDAFKEGSTLSHSGRFQYFALGDSYDLILRESKLKSEGYEKKIKELSDLLKKSKLEELVMKRKIDRLSQSPYTKEILYNYSLENFSPLEIIREVHNKIDPEAPINLEGSSGIINSDITLFSGLVEEIFNLSRDPKRRYLIRIYWDGGQMLIYFTVEGPSLIEDKKMQELKDRAKLLDGVFLRHQSEANTLHLVLSLNDVRNEEK